MHRIVKKEEINNAIKEVSIHGFAKINDFLTLETINELTDLVNCNYEQVKSKSRKGVPERDINDKIIYNLQSIDKKFIDIISTEPVESIAKNFLNDQYYRFLDTDIPNYILTYYNARSSGNKLDLHIDSGIPFIGSHSISMQFVFLLEDSSVDNGCTVVAPKSHQSGTFTDRSLDLSTLTHLTGKKGDMIIWDSRLWHGTIENKSGLSRWALIATLSRWWMKQQMNIPKTIPNEIYKQCSDAQKLLLGFCSLPPSNPYDRINTKNGYDFLKPNVADYDL